MSPTARTEAALPAVPDDADDLRSYHFRALLRSTKTWVYIVGAALIGGGIFSVTAFPLFGLGVFVAVALIGIFVTFRVADSRAADDFFHVYAQIHDMALGGKSTLPAVTPLLRKGDDQYAERTLTGQLAPGISGLLAIYTYVTESTDSHGNRDKDYHPYTLGMTDVPECMAHVPELYCQRKFGLRALEGLEDVFRISKQRVELESDALDDKYEIFCDRDQDANWLRQLFSPTFIVWLTESAPDRFAFELVAGTLVAYVHGHEEDSADLDRLAAATGTVAARLREESTEAS